MEFLDAADHATPLNWVTFAASAPDAAGVAATSPSLRKRQTFRLIDCVSIGYATRMKDVGFRIKIKRASCANNSSKLAASRTRMPT